MKLTAIAFAGAAALTTTAPVLALPNPGDPLPDITVYDDQGEEFQLNRLKGEYAVIVFGCLT